MPTPVSNPNYFEMFNLAPEFRLDHGLLDTHYHDLQRCVHPDKAASLGDTERRLSLQRATLANEAYRTLKKPLDRAGYLLRLHGVDTREESHAGIPTEFLLKQMEWREELHEAVRDGDARELDKLERRIKAELENHLESLGSLLDVEHSFETAADLVRRMRFLDRLSAEVNAAYELLENRTCC